MGWDQVRWTEARQVAAAMDVDEDALPEPGVSPEAHYLAIRASGDATGAIGFLGHALPRLEALAWAARILEEEAAARPLKYGDRQALDHALRWLGDQTDANRRAAMDAADAADERSPERILAMGVFFSGGSISEPDLPAIAPAPAIAGRFAAGAVTMAVIRAGLPPKFDRALALGERVATEGMKALQSQA